MKTWQRIIEYYRLIYDQVNVAISVTGKPYDGKLSRTVWGGEQIRKDIYLTPLRP
jgi:hypothetical protein